MSLSANRFYYTNTNHNDASNVLINFSNLTGITDLIQHPLSIYARELFFSPTYNNVFFNSINWANSLGKYKNHNNLINPLVSNVLMNIDVDDSEQSLISHIVKIGHIDGENTLDHSGHAVSSNADGTIIAISSHWYSYHDQSNYLRGRVRIFKWNNSSWNHIGTIDGEDKDNNFGFSISLSDDGTIVAIGAPYNDGGGIGYGAGHVRVYDYVQGRSPNEWEQLGTDIDGEGSYNLAGGCVSLNSNGTILAIGAKYNDVNTGTTNDNTGHVRVYEYTNNDWQQIGDDIDGQNPGDLFGSSVSLSDNGTIVAIGGYLNDGNGTFSGHVRVYKYNGSIWDQLGSDIDGEAAGDHCGYSVSLSSDGKIVAIGADRNSGNGNESGHVRVYDYDENRNPEWKQLGSDIDGEAADDKSGFSVSLSSDGTILAIGAPHNNGPANIDNIGHVRVYQYVSGLYSSDWVQVGYDLDGETETDLFGWSVSLSKNGSTLIVGAYQNDNTGNNSGRVYTYELLKQPITTMALMGSPIDGDGGSFGGVSLNEDGTVLAIGAYLVTGGEVRVYKYLNPNNAIENYNDHKYFSVIPTGLASPHDWAFYSFSLIQDDVAIFELKPGQETGATFDDSISLHNGNWGWQYPPSIYHNRTTPVFYVELPSNYVFSNSTITATLVNYNHTHTPASGNFVSASSPNGPWHIRGNWSVSLPLPHANPKDSGGTGVPVSCILDNGWMQMGDNINGSPQSSGERGRAMKLNADGTIIAIGAWQGSNNTGDVTIYKYDNINNSWNKLGDKIVGESGHDKSGYSVALSDDGTIVAIGAYDNDATDLPTNSQRGHIRVYEWNDNAWNKIGNDVDGEIGHTRFGWSVSLSANGKILAGGTYLNDGGGKGFGTGHVRVYDYVKDRNPEWKQLGDDIDGEAPSDYFGESISLNYDGTIIAIGAPNNDGNDNTNSQRGHIRVYQYINNNWLQMGSDIDGKYLNESSGKSISLSADGTILVIGANDYDTPGTSNNKGHAYVYKYMKGLYASDWVLIGDKYGEKDQDQLGYSVSVSKNGSVFAVGAPGYDVNGANTGRVYTYQLFEQSSIKSIIKMGMPIDGENSSDEFGMNVSSNTDGTIIAIAARKHDNTKGHVRIYEYFNPNNAVDNYNDHKYFGVIPTSSSVNYHWAIYRLKIIQSGINIIHMDPNNTNELTFKINATASGTWGWQYGPTNGTDTSVWCNTATPLWYVKTDATINGTPLSFELIHNHNTNTPYSGNFVSASSPNGPWVVRNSWLINHPLLNSTSVTYTPNGSGYIITSDLNSKWQQMGNVIDGQVSGDFFGRSVSLNANGKIVAIGAHHHDGNKGCVSIYEWDGSSWQQMGNNIVGEAADDYSGFSVSLSNDGKIVAISAYYNDGINGTNSGHVRVYDYVEGRNPEWDQLGTDIDGENSGDNSGWSISLSSNGKILAISAPNNNGGDKGSSTGHVRVYEYNDNAWNQMGSDIDGEAASDYVGYESGVSLSDDGTILAIGAHANDGNGDGSGHVRVFKWNGSAWNQMGNDIDGEEAGDLFGITVSLSADGTILAIGAHFNNNKTGHVRVFEYNGSSWIQVGYDIDGENIDDLFGIGLSLSKDGSVLVAGAYGYNGNSGRVYTYEIVETSNTIKENN